MGVLLIAATIVVAVAVGVSAERRRPLAAGLAARRALTLILYVLLPPVVFFNLAASEIDVEPRDRPRAGTRRRLARLAARLVGRQPRSAAVTPADRRGRLRRAQRQHRPTSATR